MNKKPKIDGTYCPEINCRWKSYNYYKLMLWAWMMNETTAVFSPASISHNGFYVHAAIQVIGVIFLGIPLVYSEICLAQYTNCSVISVWDIFPLFRGVGYASTYLILLRTVYLVVLASWYLEYTFYSAVDPPPWISCSYYNNTKCMVKRINVSVFQHCLEAQTLFEDDCGMKTASNCFFEQEIGENTTDHSFHCMHPWKTIIASTLIGAFVYVLSMKKEKFIQVFMKMLIVYVCMFIFILFCVALSTSGTWYASKITINWKSYSYNLKNSFHSMTRGFLSVGTGCGIILFISRDVSFRSPATMTSISVPLFSLFLSLMYGLVAFGGIKTMSFFHGEEENVIEVGSSIYFPIFASITEILMYFDALAIWPFFWFSSIFLCLLSNIWIMFLFLTDMLLQFEVAARYRNLSTLMLMIFICLLSLPFLCSDLTGSLTDVVYITQVVSCFLFSVSLYWIYGYNKHSNDIIFMIGIKASYFWKILWLLSPLFLFVIIYVSVEHMVVDEFNDSLYIQSVGLYLDELVVYVLLGIYTLIIVLGMVVECFIYYHNDEFIRVFKPSEDWGPRDKILARSRNMFVPEIMTREFLYRQVRINGYHTNKKPEYHQESQLNPHESTLVENHQWNALTSN